MFMSPVFSHHQEQESTSNVDDEEAWKEKEAIQQSGHGVRPVTVSFFSNRG